MVKLLSVLVLAGLQIGGTDLYANAHPLPQGCACRCGTEQASFRVWRQKYGHPNRFAAKTIGRWFNRMTSNSEPFSKTELLILLGRSAKGIWSVETQETDGGGEIYTDLVCMTIEGKRKVFPVIRGLYDVNASSLTSRVLRRLRQLAKSGLWDVSLLVPVQFPLLSRRPALVFHEYGKVDSEGYGWRLNVRARDGRLMRITRVRPGPGFVYFRGAKCFAGVNDDKGETWWVLLKTAFSDGCYAKWHSIRLTHSAPVKQ